MRPTVTGDNRNFNADMDDCNLPPYHKVITPYNYIFCLVLFVLLKRLGIYSSLKDYTLIHILTNSTC